MSAIEVTTETTINHRELGSDVWEWDSHEQSAFLAGFAKAFRDNVGSGLFQIHYIANELRKTPADLAAVRWLNDNLTDYLKDES